MTIYLFGHRFKLFQGGAMFSLHTIALVVSTSLLAGCTVGPDYHRPEAPFSKHYQAQSFVRKSSASRNDSLSHWWKSFNDPPLNQCISDALTQNLDLAQTTAKLAQVQSTIPVLHNGA